MKLNKSYFQHDDVLYLARDLVGKSLFTCVDGQMCGGIISETEAYKGTGDRASHAFGGRRTARNEMMYADGGVLYIYLCYGMHHLLNIVTNREDIPDAVLIRSIIPTHGEELMLRRNHRTQSTRQMTMGPGRVSKALGMTVAYNGTALPCPQVWVEDRGLLVPDADVKKTPRIGVDYAGEDALLPYRFVWQPECF